MKQLTFNFYQDNASKKEGIKYDTPTGNYMPYFVAGIEDTSVGGTFIISTGLYLGIPEGYKVIAEGAPGVTPVVVLDSEELQIEVVIEDGVTLEKGDLFGHFIVANLAIPKRVNSKKDL